MSKRPDRHANAFDRIVVVNLKRKPERLATFRANFEEFGWPFQEPERFDAIDGAAVPTPYLWEQGGGAWGCMQSHRQILERAIMDGVKSLLVFEDDAFMKSDSIERLYKFLDDVPDDWDQLMLGGQNIGTPKKVKDGVVKVTNCQRTHAYAIRGQFLRDLYAQWCSPNSRVHCDWIMGPLQSLRNVYAPEPFIFGQEAGPSDISGRTNPRKTWDTPGESLPVILLHAPAQVVAELRRYGLHTGYDRDSVTDIDNGLKHVFTCSNPIAELHRWVRDLQWEVAADEGLICTVWHPDATLDVVRRATHGMVIEINADTVDDALKQLPDLKLREDWSRSHVVVLHAPRRVMTELRGLGWHGGNWRDHVTDVDNGLREIFAQDGDKLPQLREWLDSVGKEVEGQRNGVLTVWHPDATADVIRAATSRKVVEITANSTEEALRIWRERR